jgi:hypothetical protein
MGDKYQPSSREIMVIAALGDLLQDDREIPNDVLEWMNWKLSQLKGSEKI